MRFGRLYISNPAPSHLTEIHSQHFLKPNLVSYDLKRETKHVNKVFWLSLMLFKVVCQQFGSALSGSWK